MYATESKSSLSKGSAKREDAIFTPRWNDLRANIETKIGAENRRIKQHPPGFIAI
jgi:hypothetical protein